MNRTRVSPHTYLFFQALVLLCLLLPVEALSFSLPGWRRGASGYDQALLAAENDERPLIIYFRTNWCGWCKKLDSQFLEDPDVRSFLEEIPKVEINPDMGLEEKEVQAEYRVSGYPTFLVCLPSLDRRTSKVSPFLKSGARSVDEFIEDIRSRISDHYNRQGNARHKNGDYEDAVNSYQRAAEYNPDDAGSRYGMGRTYENMARRGNDETMMRQAKNAYREALAINPGHRKSRDALARLDRPASKTAGGDGEGAMEEDADSHPEEEKGAGGGVRYWVDENGVKHYSDY